MQVRFFNSPQTHKASRALLNHCHAVMGLHKPQGQRGTGTKLLCGSEVVNCDSGAQYIPGQAKTLAQHPWWGGDVLSSQHSCSLKPQACHDPSCDNQCLVIQQHFLD